MAPLDACGLVCRTPRAPLSVLFAILWLPSVCFSDCRVHPSTLSPTLIPARTGWCQPSVPRRHVDRITSYPSSPLSHRVRFTVPHARALYTYFIASVSVSSHRGCIHWDQVYFLVSILSMYN